MVIYTRYNTLINKGQRIPHHIQNYTLEVRSKNMQLKYKVMERELYDAALQGNVSQLTSIINQDPLILHRPDLHQTTKSPLHVSAEQGHLQFTLELLKYNPHLTESIDSHKSSPLHSAASRGNLAIVRELILRNPDMCFVCDEDGRNPLHVAAIKGQVAVLEELIRCMPRAAKERAGQEGKILHLCVKYNKLECLMLLVNYVGDSELLNCRDCEGNTVLHLVVADKQIEMLKFLLRKEDWIVKNTINSNNLTPMDLLLESHEDPNFETIHTILKKANFHPSPKLQRDKTWTEHMKWLDDHRGTLMFVAPLIAQMAFTAGINPPGGFYDEGDNAGYAIAGSDTLRVRYYDVYLILCSISLFSSLSIILMLISELPCRKVIMYIAMVTMWIAILPMPLVYTASINISSRTYGKLIEGGLVIADYSAVGTDIAALGFLLWIFLLIVIAVGHVISFSMKFFTGPRGFVMKVWRSCFY